MNRTDYSCAKTSGRHAEKVAPFFPERHTRMETATADEAAVKLDDCLSCCVETCIDSLLEAKRPSSCGQLRLPGTEPDADPRIAGSEAAATEDAGKRLARIGANLSWLMEQKRELTNSGTDLLRQLRACSRLAGQIRAIQTAADPQLQPELENLRQQPLKPPPPPPLPKQRLRNLQSQQPPEQSHWLRHRQQLPQPMQHRHYQPPMPHQTQQQPARLLQPPSRLVRGLSSQLGAGGSLQQLLQSSSTRGPSSKQQQLPQPHPRRRHRTESAVFVSDGSGSRRLSQSPHQTVAVNGSSVDLQWRRSQQGAAVASSSDGQPQPRVQLFVRFSGGPGHQAGEVRQSFSSVNNGGAIRTIV